MYKNPLYNYTLDKNIKLSIDEINSNNNINSELANRNYELLDNKCPNSNDEKQDIRRKYIIDFNNNENKGNFLLHKTLRVGATTNFIAESLDRYEKICIIVPTNKIAEQTVLEEALNYTKRNPETIKIRHIPSNHQCLINQELIKEHPDMVKLPYMYPPIDCNKCSRQGCKIKEAAEDNNADAYVLTYDKLSILNNTTKPNSIAGRILKNISESKNILFDEVHELQFGKIKSLIISSKKEKINLNKYKLTVNDFKNIRYLIDYFSMLLNTKEYREAYNKVFERANDKKSFEKNLSNPIYNPLGSFALNLNKNKLTYNFYLEIKELIINRKKYKLSIKDIKNLYSMLYIAMSDTISINALKSKENNIIMRLSAVDENYIENIKSFIANNETKNKRIILTSGTICSYNYKQLFKNELKNIIFSDNGDPLNTNSKMLVLADNKNYISIGERATLKTDLDEIINNIIDITDIFGSKSCKVVAVSIKAANKIRSHLKQLNKDIDVTYYGNPELMGVKCEARIIIAVGISFVPSNSFNVMTFNDIESKRLLYEKIHSCTAQNWFRAKDPDGINASIIFGLRCKFDDCKNIVTWGINREIDIESNTINCDHFISIPTVKCCGSFKEMLTEAVMHIQNKNLDNKNISEIMIKNSSIKQVNINHNKSNNKFSVKNFKKVNIVIRDKKNLIRYLINDNNMSKSYFIRDKKGTRMLVKLKLYDGAIEQHFAGNIDLETPLLKQDNYDTIPSSSDFSFSCSSKLQFS